MHPAQTFTARRSDIVVEEVINELLIYDRRADVGHCLGDIAAVTWRTCEGGATLGEIAEQLIAHDLAGSVDDATELAGTAVSALVDKGLLDNTSGLGTSSVSRRQALRRIASGGAAAVLAPLIVSAAVPTSAFASASHPCVANGGPCTPGTSTCCTSTYACSSSSHKCCPLAGGHCNDDSDCYRTQTSGCVNNKCS